MRRVAFCTPVNPVQSGISDYSEELLPYLGQYLDLTVVVDKGVRPENQQLLRHLPVVEATQLLKQHRRQPFDAVIYHMGNSPAHSTFYELLGQLPGVVVLHDAVLQHLMLWRAANVERKIDRYITEMTARYGERGARVAAGMARGQLSDQAFDFPLHESVVERADALIAHSSYVAEQVRALRPELPLAIVPMGVPLPPEIGRAEARARLDLPADALIWASFGHVNPYKRIEQALRAFNRVRADYPDARYVLVGSVSPNLDLTGLLRRLGLEQVVRVTGHIPASAFNDYVASADLCLNLRHPTAGETSASLLRLLGAGRPVLVSANGSFAELPPGVAAQVDLGPAEEAQIEAYGRAFARFPALAAALGAQARSYVAADHTLEAAAAGYVDFLARRYGWGEQQRRRPPLWDLAPEPALRPAPQHSAPEAPAAQIELAIVAQAAASLDLQPDDAALLDRAAARLRGLISPAS